jgi:hypothetical protein
VSTILLLAVAVVIAATLVPVGEPENEIGSGEIRPAIPTKTITATTDNPFDAKTFPTRLADDIAKVAQQRALLVRVSNADTAPVPFDVPVGLIQHFQRTPQFCLQHVPSHTRVRSHSHHQGGWILVHFQHSSNSDHDSAPTQFVVYSASSKPVMVELPAAPDALHYADIVLSQTPANELTTLSGIALDEEENPIADARVYIRAHGVSGITSPLKHVHTDIDGRFTFDRIVAQPYYLFLGKQGYAAASESLVISAERLETRHTHVMHYYRMQVQCLSIR